MSSSVASKNVKLKRAYEPRAADDGMRVLVDRLWPRGLSKEKAALDQWMKDIAPSAKLRRWFGHDPARWGEFRRRYAEEVYHHPNLLEQLRSLARTGTLTLVYSARDEVHNDAAELRTLILGGKEAHGQRANATGRGGARPVAGAGTAGTTATGTTGAPGHDHRRDDAERHL